MSEKPLTEEELSAMLSEADEWAEGLARSGMPGGAALIGGLAAEVRRLRGLFTEEDARIVEAMLQRWDGLVPVYASEDDHDPLLRGATDEEYDRGDSLPARIRSVTGEP